MPCLFIHQLKLVFIQISPYPIFNGLVLLEPKQPAQTVNLIGLQLDFNNSILICFGKGGSSGTFATSFTVKTYALTYCVTGSSDIDWMDRLKSRTVSGWSIAESKGTHLYIAIGY